MNANTRRNVLGGGVLLLLAFVVADRTGVLDRLRGSAEASDSVAQQLAADASLLARQQALVEAQPSWAAAEAQAERAWQDVRASVLRAETRPLAEADLRERLRATLGNLPGITAPEAISVNRAATPTADANAQNPAAPRIERLRFRVGFDAAEHHQAIEAIDRLSRLNAPRLRVESLSITGPGEMQDARTGLTVSLEVEAVAIIGGPPDAALTEASANAEVSQG